MREILDSELDLVHRTLTEKCIVVSMDADGHLDIRVVGDLARALRMPHRHVENLITFLASENRVEYRDRKADSMGRFRGGWLRAIGSPR